MLINRVNIEPGTKIKIYQKHNVTEEEVEYTLLLNKPMFRKVNKLYMAIGKWYRYLTIFFEYDKKLKMAEIKTAYPSSKWQIKQYKKK